MIEIFSLKIKDFLKGGEKDIKRKKKRKNEEDQKESSWKRSYGGES